MRTIIIGICRIICILLLIPMVLVCIPGVVCGFISMLFGKFAEWLEEDRTKW